MSEHIIPFFKAGDYESGILIVSVHCRKWLREKQLSLRPRPWWHYGLVVLGL